MTLAICSDNPSCKKNRTTTRQRNRSMPAKLPLLGNEPEEMTLFLDGKSGNLRAPRRLDESVSYWRHRAGWFDDDKSMSDYNSGVYDKYYQVGDDDRIRRGKRNGGGGSTALATTLKVFVLLSGIVLFVLIVRSFQRSRAASVGEVKRESKERSRSDRSDGGGSRRSRSKSNPGRSRSRSKSRNRASSNYELMDDDNESPTSSRSRSNSKRNRSRSRTSTRSRSKTASSRMATKEAILV